MKSSKNTILFLLCIITLSACSTKIHDANPTAGIVGEAHDSDPLKIGAKPTPPVDKKTHKAIIKKPDSAMPVVGARLLPQDKQKRFNTRVRRQLTEEMAGKNGKNSAKPILNADSLSAQNAIPPINSDWLVLQSPGGAALTIWALAQGNWIWGYSLIDSIGFGGARIWRLRFFDNNEVMIENALTQTCLNGYKNGLIHMACNTKNRYQRFKLIPMSNESFQLRNVGLDKCVQAPIKNIFGDFHAVFPINLVKCATGSNLDQQWYIAPPTFLVRPLYDRK